MDEEWWLFAPKENRRSGSFLYGTLQEAVEYGEVLKAIGSNRTPLQTSEQEIIDFGRDFLLSTSAGWKIQERIIRDSYHIRNKR